MASRGPSPSRALWAQPPLRRPAAPLGGGLQKALLKLVVERGSTNTFDLGHYDWLTKDKAVHAPSLAANPELVGGR
eukprot:9483399-Pyramimonas_sp.AAC.2